MIQKFIIHGSQMEYGKHLDNLYNCHNILFKHDIMYYPTSTSYAIPKSELINQEFTIHHFIYYLIFEAVKIYKRQSKRFTEWDVYDLIEDNVYKAHDFYLSQLFDTKFKIYNLYKYLYLINSENIISFILDINNLHYNLMSTDSIDFDFINLTEDDLINYNEELLSSYFDIDVVKNMCKCNNLKCFDNTKSSNNGIGFVNFYKQTIAKERLQQYEAELIEKTWHPSRLIDWCFDNEEKNDIGLI